jgi:16S rRNA (cytosine967-C5)-methyltransferase
VVKELGARGEVVEWLDARPLLPGVPELGDGPDVQLWPHRHGTDAMYLALLRRAG